MVKNVLTIVFTLAALAVAADDLRVSVRYVSADHVYVDKGRAAGLQVGDTLKIESTARHGVVLLEVLFVADHSASCGFLGEPVLLRKGETAVRVGTRQSTQQESTADTLMSEKAKPVPPPLTQKTVASKSLKTMRLRGTATAGLSSYRDNSRTLNEPDFGLRINAQDLLDGKMHFRLRWRSRYYLRDGYSAGLPEDEWRHRLYEASLEYQPVTSTRIRAGRILAGSFSAAGFLDGVLLSQSLSENWSAGLYAGSQPDYRDNSLDTDTRKGGLFAAYKKEFSAGRRFEHTLAIAASYHLGEIDREMLFTRNSFYTSRWSLYQMLEVDYNRAWRMEKSGTTFTLSSLYLSARYSFNADLSAGLSYDTRRSYYTWQTRSLADSLFDDAARSGWRADVQWRPLRKLHIGLRGGWRERASDNAAKFASARVSARRIWKGVGAAFDLQVFDNAFSEGYYPGVTFYWDINAGWQVSGGYTIYNYKLKQAADYTRQERWQFSVLANLTQRLYWSGWLQQQNGAGPAAIWLNSGLGYRL